MNEQNLDGVSREQKLYGQVVHCITIVAAMIALLSPVLILWRPDANVLDPNSIFASIWQGEGVEQIWSMAQSGFPGGHFYLRNFFAGDSLGQFGIALGCSVALWGLIPATISYFREKDYLYASMGTFIAILIVIAMLGV